MIEVSSGLFVGGEVDYEREVKKQPGWHVVHACKEPYHRQLLKYTGRGAPKDHPEYLLAERGNRLFLNIVDVEDPAYINKGMIDHAMGFVHGAMKAGSKALIHCNQGESRGPSIGLLYLAAHTDALPVGTFEEAEAAFRRIYPSYNPKRGIRGFIQANWGEYAGKRRGS